MKCWYDRIISVTDVVFFHIVILLAVMYVGLFQTGFMEEECEKYQVAEKLGITEQELHHVIADMIYVARGNSGSPDATVNIDGQDVPFFNEREKQHITDVSDLVKRLRGIGMAGIVVILAATFYLLKTGKKKLLCKTYLCSWPVWLCLVLLTGVCMLIDLTGFINTFHRLFFDNNRWILNPAKDRLIWLFPEKLFADAVFRLVTCLALIHGTVILLSIKIVKKKG